MPIPARAAKPRKGDSAVAGHTCPMTCVGHIVGREWARGYEESK